MLSQVTQKLEEAFRSYNENPQPFNFEKLKSAIDTARSVGLTAVNSPVYKSAERFVKSMEDAKKAVNGDLDSKKVVKVTFKVWDVGGQEVCFHMHVFVLVSFSSNRHNIYRCSTRCDGCIYSGCQNSS